MQKVAQEDFAKFATNLCNQLRMSPDVHWPLDIGLI